METCLCFFDTLAAQLYKMAILTHFGLGETSAEQVTVKSDAHILGPKNLTNKGFDDSLF